MSIIFDGIIVLCLLIALIKGLTKGFMKSIWGLVTLAIMVVGIYFAAPPLTKIACEKTTIDSSLSSSMENLYAKIKGMDTELNSEDIDGSLQLMKDNGVPSFAVSALSSTIKKYMPTEGTITAKALMGERTAYLIIMIGISLLLIIVLGIIINILKKMFFGVAKIGVVKPVDRLLGLVYCVVFTAAIFIAVGGIAYTMKDLSFMSKVNSSAEDSFAFKYIYGQNPLQEIFDEHVNLGNYLNKYI
jgi:hypothetical protein